MLTAWTRQFIRTDGPTRMRDLLVQMNQAIRDQFRYVSRDEEGTQTPLRTLALGSGTCRDFALLMMEAARHIGIATRFVSGYLYDPALDTATTPTAWTMTRPTTPSAPAAPTPGCRPTCRARAGCPSTRPTTCSAAASSSASAWRATRARPRRCRAVGMARPDAYLGMQATVVVKRQTDSA